jgi:tRNA threonylcarbamoyladenosine biosynthesis protein TsaB
MRPYTLALDGSTYEGSVALLRESVIVAERTVEDEGGGAPRGGRGEKLMPAIAECLESAGASRKDIARIVCGAGPGSFTSLRVAGSIAKGLAEGLGIELFVVCSLTLTVSGARPPLPPGDYLSVLDAMRGEFFASRIILPTDGVAIQTEPATLTSTAQLELVRSRDNALRVVGPGQEIDARPHARGVAPILVSIIESGPVDLASWEPDYGRLAEAQVRWEAAHGRPLTT